MTEAVSLNSIFVWFVWGLFMGFGWTLGSWLMSKILGRIG